MSRLNDPRDYANAHEAAQRNRAMIDAIRELLALPPLYDAVERGGRAYEKSRMDSNLVAKGL